MRATSGAHGRGGEAVELEDGGEELSTPAVKRKCIQDDSMSLMPGLGREFVHYESVTPPRHLSPQYRGLLFLEDALYLQEQLSLCS